MSDGHSDSPDSDGFSSYFDAKTTNTSFSWLKSGPETTIAVRVDRPGAGLACGALVIAPPFGREYVAAFRTLRALAAAAVRAGLVVVSPTYSGQGDSHPLPAGADLATTWVSDLSAATGLAAQLSAGGPVHVVGLRLAAAVVCGLPAPATGERHLLWEPISGAAFLRQQRNLRKFAVAQPPVPELTEIYGGALSPEQDASLRGLLVSEPLPGRTVRKESDREVARKITNPALHFAEVPLESIAEIVSGLPLGEPRRLPRWSPVPASTVPGPTGPVVEEFVEVGPHRLHGVLAKAPESRPALAVVLTAMGVELANGPADLWVGTARGIAASGAVMVLRADRRGIGEDVDVHRRREPAAYVETSAVDVAEAAREAVALGAQRVLGVGVCAGAWCMLKASAAVPELDVLSVNSVHWNPDEAFYDAAFYDRFHGTESQLVRTLTETDAPHPRPGPIAFARFTLVGARKRVAYRWPRLLARLKGRPVPARVGALLRLVPAQSRLILLMGRTEHELFEAQAGRRAVAHRRRGGTRVLVDPEIDHNLLSVRARSKVESVIADWVSEQRVGDRSAQS